MLVYLWHMVPVVIVAIAFYPTGVLPQPAIGSAEWWELRPAWIALLAMVLIPLIAGLVRLHRPLLAVLPTGLTPARPWSAAVLVAGLAAAGYGLTSLAIGGFAPGGRPRARQGRQRRACGRARALYGPRRSARNAPAKEVPCANTASQRL